MCARLDTFLRSLKQVSCKLALEAVNDGLVAVRGFLNNGRSLQISQGVPDCIESSWSLRAAAGTWKWPGRDCES